jgi:hypothetical protein
LKKQLTPASSIEPKSRIVVFAQGVEGTNLLEQRTTLIERHGFDALGNDDGPSDEGAAEGVIELANAAGFGFGRVGLAKSPEVGRTDGGCPVARVRQTEGRPEGRPDAL